MTMRLPQTLRSCCLFLWLSCAFLFTTTNNNHHHHLHPDNGPEDPHIYMNSKGDPGPYRGRKRSLYDGGTRMPFIARWPGKVPAGRIADTQLMSADWLWTVAALAGGSEFAQSLRESGATTFGPPLGEDRAGDLVPSLFPPPKPRNQSIMFDYRADGYGFCWHQAPRLAILRKGWKLLLNPDHSRLELFNKSVSFEVGRDSGEGTEYCTCSCVLPERL